MNLHVWQAKLKCDLWQHKVTRMLLIFVDLVICIIITYLLSPVMLHFKYTPACVSLKLSV